MATVWYWAVIEHHAGEYWATLPDLPGPNAADPDHDKALRLLAEFAADHVADLVEHGAPVPAARNAEEIERDPEVEEWGRALVPVDVPGKSVKINMSIDDAVLARIDRAADEAGETRSGFLVSAALHRIRETTNREIRPDDVRRLLKDVDFSKVDLAAAIAESMKKD